MAGLAKRGRVYRCRSTWFSVGTPTPLSPISCPGCKLGWTGSRGSRDGTLYASRDGLTCVRMLHASHQTTVAASQATPPSQHGCDCIALANSILPRRNGSWDRVTNSPVLLPQAMPAICLGCFAISPRSAVQRIDSTFFPPYSYCMWHPSEKHCTHPSTFRHPYGSTRQPYGNYA